MIRKTSAWLALGVVVGIAAVAISYVGQQRSRTKQTCVQREAKSLPLSYRRFGKRIFDVIVSLIALVALSPVMGMIAVLVLVFHGSPILFRQERPGLYGKPFTLLKFRTMTNETDADGNLLPADQRLTRFGCLLRKTSLDELPELVNVLRGDMSLVGPRPLLKQYLPLYTTEQARRHDAKPGITGWAQINGRNGISWEEKFNLDVWYVDNVSFSLDFQILFTTAWKVIRREGINQDGFTGMDFFRGSPIEEVVMSAKSSLAA